MERSESESMVDGVVAAAIRELEQQRENARYHAERVCGDAIANVKTLAKIATRDVFKDALVVAAGELKYPTTVDAGWRIHTGLGGSSLEMTVTRSRMNGGDEAGREMVAKLVAECSKRSEMGQPSSLRAVLVVFRDDLEDDVAKARAKV